MKYFTTAFGMMCGITLLMCYQLGNDWLTIGHGINPLLAGGFIVFLFLAPFAITYLSSDYASTMEEEEDNG